MPINTTQQLSICLHCSMSGMCFSKTDITKSEPKVRSHKIYHKSDVLFTTGQTFDAIYILRSGSAKSSVIGNCGQEQISHFHYPGHLIGLDGFDDGTHAQSIKFLETSSVCRIGLGELDSAMTTSPSIRYKLLQGMSQALNDDDRSLLNVNNMNSSQRLSSFLLNLAEQFEKRGLSGNEFNLSMTRVDIANYLGMAIETVSRLLTHLQNEQIIQVQKRRVLIGDIEKLKQTIQPELHPKLRVSAKKPQSIKVH